MKVLNSVEEPYPFIWNTVISGNLMKQNPLKAILLYNQMLCWSVEPDHFTFTFLLKACTQLPTPTTRKYTELDIVTWNSMLEGYADNRDGESLHQLFDRMPSRHLVSWNTMIAFHVQVGEFRQAIEVFQRMQEKGIQPNPVTLISVLSAFACLGALAQERWIHAYIDKHGIELDENLGSSLINMYAKCGNKSVHTWNAMIFGLAANGQSLKALELFSKMKSSGIRPNAITFSYVLNSCSHGGLFNRIEETIRTMPMKPDAVMWKALLGACRIHKNLEMGEQAGLKLIELAPNDHASYALLSNIYAMADKWDKVHEVRKLMWERRIMKPPGSSSIELDGVVYKFAVGDTAHSRKKEIYKMLGEMGERLKNAGYEPDAKQCLLDIDDEEVKQTSLGHHSEKLAIAFGFINTKPGTTIRMVKNLHVCGDFHSAIKLLSKIYNREVIVRDSNRFHYFKNGSCSCMDSNRFHYFTLEDNGLQFIMVFTCSKSHPAIRQTNYVSW
uniref:DYW domain-containing protein n=1 Tax=Nelumbo nucifera TaxID=4432 RepID=A0A822YE19_NELNU|nr:TPA_asm: hypothetical protein HUJ06_030764 [Nelumbo nucifera]